MPLVVVCGRPLGGKTVRSYALAACLREDSYVAQFEHTLALKPTGKEVFSRGDDY